MPVSEGYVRAYVAGSANDVRHVIDSLSSLLAFSFTSGTTPKYEQVTLAASGFTALTVPAGAKAVLVVFPTTGATSLTLKGVTGDTGVTFSAANLRFILLPITPGTIGFAKGDAGTIVIEVFWL